MPITNNNNLFQDYGKRFGRRQDNRDGAMQRMNNLVKNQNDARIGHQHTDRFDQTEKTEQSGYRRYGKDTRSDDSSLAVTGNRRANQTDTKLGEAEYDYLEKLKEKYGNVDFVIADFEDGEDTSKYAVGSDKEYTCIITPALLKKMAADEETAAKYEKVIEGAGADLDSLKEQISALDTDESEEDPVNLKEQVQNYGFSVDDTGKVNYFALLRDSLPSYNNADDESQGNGYQYIEADSVDSLLKKMKEAIDAMREKAAEKDESLAVTAEGGNEGEQAADPATETAATDTTLDILG
jgi:hypothetical protein